MKHRDALEIIRTLACDPLVNEISRDEPAGELLFALAIDWEPDDPYLIGPIFTLRFDAQANALCLHNHETGRTLRFTGESIFCQLYVYLGAKQRNLRYATLEEYVEAEVGYA